MAFVRKARNMVNKGFLSSLPTMLVRSSELAAENVRFNRRMVCHNNTLSWLQNSAKAIVANIVIDHTIVKSLPESLILVLLKEALRHRYQEQVKKLITLWPHSKLDIFMIAKSRCLFCYDMFVEDIEKKIKGKILVN